MAVNTARNLLTKKSNFKTDQLIISMTMMSVYLSIHFCFWKGFGGRCRHPHMVQMVVDFYYQYVRYFLMVTKDTEMTSW